MYFKGYKSSDKTHHETKKERAWENTDENTHRFKKAISLKTTSRVIKEICLHRSKKYITL